MILGRLSSNTGRTSPTRRTTSLMRTLSPPSRRPSDPQDVASRRPGFTHKGEGNRASGLGLWEAGAPTGVRQKTTTGPLGGCSKRTKYASARGWGTPPSGPYPRLLLLRLAHGSDDTRAAARERQTVVILMAVSPRRPWHCCEPQPVSLPLSCGALPLLAHPRAGTTWC